MVQYSNDNIFYRLCVTAILYWLHILKTWRLWRGSLSLQLQFSAENERFRQCGVDEMRVMATFYQELLRKAGIEVDEVLAEYNHYKIFAKGRAAVPMRELFMSVLQSGVNIECRMCDRLVKCQII